MTVDAQTVHRRRIVLADLNYQLARGAQGEEISQSDGFGQNWSSPASSADNWKRIALREDAAVGEVNLEFKDRKSTRLNSSHDQSS